MKKFAPLTAMAFLLATAGAFAQAPSTTPPAGNQTTTKAAPKTAKAGHKGHRKAGKTTTTPAPTPAAK